MKITIGFKTTQEMKEKIESAAANNKKNSSDIIREALDSYFQKQNEKELLVAMFQRLDSIKNGIQNLDLVGNRTNSFLNFYAENRLNAEDYKKLRADVLKEIKELMVEKGYK